MPTPPHALAAFAAAVFRAWDRPDRLLVPTGGRGRTQESDPSCMVSSTHGTVIAMLRGADAGARAATTITASPRRRTTTALIAATRRSLSGAITGCSRRGIGEQGRAQGLAMPRRRAPRVAWTFGGSEGVVNAAGSRNSSTTNSSRSTLVFTAPSEELEEGLFERPTPLLLVAGEGQPSTWWVNKVDLRQFYITAGVLHRDAVPSASRESAWLHDPPRPPRLLFLRVVLRDEFRTAMLSWPSFHLGAVPVCAFFSATRRHLGGGAAVSELRLCARPPFVYGRTVRALLSGCLFLNRFFFSAHSSPSSHSSYVVRLDQILPVDSFVVSPRVVNSCMVPLDRSTARPLDRSRLSSRAGGAAQPPSSRREGAR